MKPSKCQAVQGNIAPKYLERVYEILKHLDEKKNETLNQFSGKCFVSPVLNIYFWSNPGCLLSW